MSIHRFKYLFQQFVNNIATPDERREFLSLVNKHTYDKEVQVLLDELWQDPSSLVDMERDKSERIFNSILAAADSSKGNIFRLKSSWFKIAAAILLISGVSAALFKEQSTVSENKVISVRSPEEKKSEVPSRRYINLPDGSAVILNENSKLEISKDFGSINRSVILIGEAYFDITHDEKRPFIVKTGKLRTTVLGTAFNIKANPGNETVTVTVTRGKVKVGDDDHIYNVIDPNEQVVFNSELNTHTKMQVEAKAVKAWTAGDIYFDDVSLKDVANQLQERFNISVLFSNEQIKSCRFSATFLKSQSLGQILNIIGEFNQIKYHFKNKNSVILDGTGCI